MPLTPSSQPRMTSPMPRRNLMTPLSKRAPLDARRPSYLTCTVFPEEACTGLTLALSTEYCRPDGSFRLTSGCPGFPSWACCAGAAAGLGASAGLLAAVAAGLAPDEAAARAAACVAAWRIRFLADLDNCSGSALAAAFGDAFAGAALLGASLVGVAAGAALAASAAGFAAAAAAAPADAAPAAAAAATGAAAGTALAAAPSALGSFLAAFAGRSSALSSSGCSTPSRRTSLPSQLKVTSSSSKRATMWQWGSAPLTRPSARVGCPGTEQ
mmetsp:Transcript_13612/g.38755  ORF Transcript_13612/g.38755 Transcript_13612/m.38755 type:complete len:270 (+) Transcript_13612:203-1012(+)